MANVANGINVANDAHLLVSCLALVVASTRKWDWWRIFLGIYCSKVFPMLSEIDRNNPIVRHSFEFALMVDAYCNDVRQLGKYDLSRQLFKSGTSIGANVWEAQEAESRADFIHKMKIAAKEAGETHYWLLICKHAENYPLAEPLLNKLQEIRRLLSAILFSSKK